MHLFAEFVIRYGFQISLNNSVAEMHNVICFR